MASKVRCRAETQRPRECLHFRTEDHRRRLSLCVTNHCCDVPTQQEDALCHVYLILTADLQIERPQLVYPSYTANAHQHLETLNSHS